MGESSMIKKSTTLKSPFQIKEIKDIWDKSIAEQKNLGFDEAQFQRRINSLRKEEIKLTN